MSKADSIDFFLDPATLEDPFSYYALARAQGPIYREPHHDVFMVTGYEETRTIYHDPDTFSSCVSVSGPFPPFPAPLEGDDVSETIESVRDQLLMNDQLPTFDPPKHTRHRALLMKLLTPARLRENEAFMWQRVDAQIDEFIDRGHVEVVRDFAGPFTLLVIADLLGVPSEHHEMFRKHLQEHGDPDRVAGSTNVDKHTDENPLEFLYEYFARYIEERRGEPRQDALTRLAQARFPDGELPEVIDAVRIAANLFAAGQETTVRLITAAMLILARDPAMAERLRADPERIPAFIEETLRMESPVKGSFRMARFKTEVAGVMIPAGGIIMLLNAAANRDPKQFPDPDRFDPERANARTNIAFGSGEHFCPGANLARAEGRVSIARLLARMREIRIPEDTRLTYLPTYMLRGLEALPLEFEKVV
jgi:cytochrome P450